MSLKTLRKGLATLKEGVKKRKDALALRLKKREKISKEDEVWLDNAANHVDEDALIVTLENTSDSERGLSHLDSKQKGMVQKLKEIAGGGEETAEVSRKRKSCSPAEQGGSGSGENYTRTLYPEDPAQGSPFGTGSANAITPEFKRLVTFQGDFLFLGPRQFYLEHASARQNMWSWSNLHGKTNPVIGAFHGSDSGIWFPANTTTRDTVGVDALSELEAGVECAV
ncbi:hypothetical protein B0H17DRAFT_1215458 [Mycena rosella]|uniref:Uncharacterized protein n=1 Tax=Mycena rosella TaxID=1033263 RepID=A0AAD7FXR8_MYCRO|nr:hypothetical protein B0H17DRAFT_1215458 [Mycena rosella]